MPTARALVVSLLIALAEPSIARADRPPRGEIALTDLTVDVAVGAGVAFESPHLVIAGVTAYALAAPALHAAHGDAPGAGVSLALRVGLPLVIGLTELTRNKRHGFCQSWLLTTQIECDESLFSQKMWMARQRTLEGAEEMRVGFPGHGDRVADDARLDVDFRVDLAQCVEGQLHALFDIKRQTI